MTRRIEYQEDEEGNIVKLRSEINVPVKYYGKNIGHALQPYRSRNY
jgi:hypothetical protein